MRSLSQMVFIFASLTNCKATLHINRHADSLAAIAVAWPRIREIRSRWIMHVCQGAWLTQAVTSGGLEGPTTGHTSPRVRTDGHRRRIHRRVGGHAVRWTWADGGRVRARSRLWRATPAPAAGQ